ncbi:MAG: epoxyqueuosine reductase QueH [Dehalococcoidia bacterium]|nr:MAG: epoxyqueuosine reductase QueH [Dehalococcoidia bacterium]
MKLNSVLIHCCCAHCTAYTVDYWRSQGYKTSAFWYNPNIHPFAEHEYRLEAMQFLATKLDFEIIIYDKYEMTEFFKRVIGRESMRCRCCLGMRMQKTGETALEYGFKSFTSSLLISPHQKHEVVLETGNTVAEDTGIRYLYADLRKYYSQSRCITKPLGLYRQQYCGCIYSELERFAAEKK